MIDTIKGNAYPDGTADIGMEVDGMGQRKGSSRNIHRMTLEKAG